MTKHPRTIAVDLTPVLPGGENGGAKIFVLDLLRQLSQTHTDTQFVLLTQAASHDELAALDRENVSRKMVLGPSTSGSLQPRLKRLALRVAPRIPARVRRVVSRVGYRINTRLKRRGSSMLLKNLGADLLFCPFTAPTYFEPGIPTVCTIYDLQYKTYPEFFAPADVAHRAQTFIDAARRSTVLAAISDYSRDSAIKHGNIDPSRIRTIHLRMAHRIAHRAGTDLSILDKLQIATQGYVVYPANFWKHKNHEMLLTAFGMAARSGQLPADIKLVCTGSPGARQDYLMNAAREMGVGDRIIFPGYLSNDDLGALIANCRAVIFPSLYEGFGLPVIEAMAAGVPVACSNTTSLPEVAGDAAVTFDPRVPDQIASAIIRVVNDDQLRKRLVDAGVSRVAEFSDSERMATEYWELFTLALNGGMETVQITGVTPDGWLGPNLSVQVKAPSGPHTLEVKVSVPRWFPQPNVVIASTHDGRPLNHTTKVAHGSEGVVRVPLDADGGVYEFQLSPTFVPAHCGFGSDQRHLSAKLEQCSVIGLDEKRTVLYPESE